MAWPKGKKRGSPKKKAIANDSTDLTALINDAEAASEAYAQASRADEMAGGGDPLDTDVIRANYALTKAEVERAFARLRRRY